MADFAQAYSDLGWPTEAAAPVVYSTAYNIHFFGIERLHPFDAGKFQKISRALKDKGLLPQTVPAVEVSGAVLLDVHTREYLDPLNSSSRRAAEVFELPPLRFLPVWLLNRLLLRKMRTHVGGTMLAVGLAAQRGWAINLGGGMHHASHSDGSGWCPYSDITLAVRRVRTASRGRVQRVMVIDTDAHQGNGYARDKLHFSDSDLFIVDLYNADVFPQDREAQKAIDVDVPLHTGCQDTTYLAALDRALDQAFAAFKPDLVIHNAGTDILSGDPLGRLNVSMDAVIERDGRVWQRCRSTNTPVCMLLSGGYASTSCQTVIASLASILAGQSTSDASIVSARTPPSM